MAKTVQIGAIVNHRNFLRWQSLLFSQVSSVGFGYCDIAIHATPDQAIDYESCLEPFAPPILADVGRFDNYGYTAAPCYRGCKQTGVKNVGVKNIHFAA